MNGGEVTLQNPDIIYFNGEIHTMDAEENIYEAIAVKDGKIVAVGKNNEVLKLQAEATEIMDLHKKTVVPGFIDAHVHLFPFGFNLTYVDCQLDSVEEVVEAITERAKALDNEKEWIIGWRFDESKYKERRKLTKWDFQHIKNPVYITRYCMHEAVINEPAIQKANITSQTEVKGGIIECDDHGEMTGLLVENARNLVSDVLPQYTTENMKRAITLANQQFLKDGITSVHDAGLGFLIDSSKEFEVLKEMCEEGLLQIKMYVMVLAENYQEFYKKHKHEESDQLKIGALKLFADGTLSGETAALFEPYKDSTNKGMLLYTDEELKRNMKIAYDLNKPVAIHAIGDRAIDQAIRTFEALQEEYSGNEHRPRIEHTTVSNKSLRQRMKKINAIPVPQPTLIYTAGDMYVTNVEKERLDNVFAIKSLINEGLKPAGSSDIPVTDISPLIGMASAMTRKTIKGITIGKEQIIGLKDAIKLYTNNAAHAAFEEDIKGSLEVNKVADLVVLPEGFMDFSAEEVKQSEVEMTIVNGTIVYKKDESLIVKK